MLRTIFGFAALLTLLTFLASIANAQHAPHAVGKQHGPIGWPREAKGYGTTVELAQASAMEHAVKRIAACLDSQDPPLNAWHPDESYVKKHLIKGAGEQGDDFAIVDNGPKLKTWIVEFQEPTKWHEMVQFNRAEVRRQSANERQSTAAFGLAGATALLAVGWGYLRLDEWTKGRFSRWLAIGAVTVLGASGVIWWMST